MKILEQFSIRPIVADLAAIPGVLGAWFVGALPTIALTVTVVYTLVRLWESDTAKLVVKRWRKKSDDR